MGSTHGVRVSHYVYTGVLEDLNQYTLSASLLCSYTAALIRCMSLETTIDRQAAAAASDDKR